MPVKAIFVLCLLLFAHGSNAEDSDGVQQLKLILQKLDELQSIVNTQNNRISALEKQNQYLGETVKAQGEEIAFLISDTRYNMSQSSYEKKCSKLEKKLQHIMSHCNKNKESVGYPYYSGADSTQHEGSLIRKGIQ
jgi:outer membrane murein-binding lipoprotein Lpp